MDITIVGGGNIGTQFAVHCAKKGHHVTVYCSRPAAFARHLVVVDAAGRTIHEGDIALATDDASAAFARAGLIFVALPPHCMADAADKIAPFAHKGMAIGLIPGTGGGECAFRQCMEAGAALFGMQRVPSVARLVAYGKSVCATGYRKTLHVAALQSCHTQECCGIVSELFGMPCEGLPNYLNLTLTPSNPILHTARLRVVFKDYKDGVVYESLPLFYGEWDDESSELLLLCDHEVQGLCKKLDRFDLTGVRSLREHYGSATPGAMTKKLRGIPSLKGIETPSARVRGGYIPDFRSRYFTADFPFGLTILIQLARMAGVPTPNMDATMRWYEGVAPGGRSFCFQDYGIAGIEDVERFYSR